MTIIVRNMVVKFPSEIYKKNNKKNFTIKKLFAGSTNLYFPVWKAYQYSLFVIDLNSCIFTFLLSYGIVCGEP